MCNISVERASVKGLVHPNHKNILSVLSLVISLLAVEVLRDLPSPRYSVGVQNIVCSVDSSERFLLKISRNIVLVTLARRAVSRFCTDYFF